MADTSYEEATRCPKCGNPGDVVKKEAAPAGANLPRGTQIHTVYCRHPLCPWYNTCWLVQVNSDGSVPPPQNHTFSPKLYHGFEGHDEEAARIVASLRATQQLSLQPDKHGEIRNPRG
jgi:hypothetical protein